MGHRSAWPPSARTCDAIEAGAARFRKRQAGGRAACAARIHGQGDVVLQEMVVLQIALQIAPYEGRAESDVTQQERLGVRPVRGSASCAVAREKMQPCKQVDQAVACAVGVPDVSKYGRARRTGSGAPASGPTGRPCPGPGRGLSPATASHSRNTRGSCARARCFLRPGRRRQSTASMPPKSIVRPSSVNLPSITPSR